MLSMLLFTLARPADDPAKRFEDFMKSAKTFSASLKMTVSGSPDTATGSFSVKRPKYLLFKMKWGKSDYSFSIMENDIVAIEREFKSYREYGGIGRFFIPEPDISRTPAYGFPSALMAGTLAALVPPGTPLKPDGKGEVDGISVDFVSATWRVQVGQITARAAIDGLGRPVEFERRLSGEGASFTKIRVSDYKVNEPLTDRDFATPVPAGYVPETLPPDTYPLNVGEKMPLDGWRALSGASTLESSAGNKMLFLAVSAPDCEASHKSAATVRAIARSVTAKGGYAAAISVDSSKSQKPVFASLPTFIDPQGSAYDRLRAPGTPMFFLVAPNHRITRVWYGFDVAQAGQFAADVVSWIDKTKNPGAFFDQVDGE